MTVTVESTKVTLSGNDATTVWPFTFAVQDEDEIVVTLTESDGTVTVLPSSAYSVSINPAIAPNPTPVGGSVTYPLSGSPVASGDLITVERDAAYTQPTSLANQGITWQKTIEQALDNLTFQTQQLFFQLGQRFSVPVSDDPPAVLPVAADRANSFAGFDADGNLGPIAGTITEVTVSSAMVPVVGASTLALARTALGLGTLATEAIGAGLEDDGANGLRVINPISTDGINTAITGASHLRQRIATAAITYTLPDNATLFAGFGFWVAATGGDVTFAIDAGDNFNGMAAGTSLIIPNGTQIWITTDAAGKWYIREDQLVGMDSPLNLTLTAAVAANALTIAVKDRNGQNPSITSPVVVAFRDPTATNGNPVLRALTSALSIVVPNGAELGTADGVPFRLWVVLFDNAGSLVVGTIQTVTGGAAPTAIASLDESALTTGTAISTGADSAATFYSTSGVTTKAFRILGYVDFATGQASKGVWATAASKVQLFGPGIKLPGDVVQWRNIQVSALATGTGVIPADDTIPQISEGDEYMTLAITPKATMNVLEIEAQGQLANGATIQVVSALFQDATVGALVAIEDDAVAVNDMVTHNLGHNMTAATVASTTFRYRAGGASASTTTFNGENAGRLFGGVCNSFMKIKEYMV